MVQGVSKGQALQAEWVLPSGGMKKKTGMNKASRH